MTTAEGKGAVSDHATHSLGAAVWAVIVPLLTLFVGGMTAGHPTRQAGPAGGTAA